jgi:hypothetical protein
MIGTLVWPLAAFSSMFLTDAPGTESSLIVEGLTLSLIGYPIPVIIGNIRFWGKDQLHDWQKRTLISSSGYFCIFIFLLAASGFRIS